MAQTIKTKLDILDRYRSHSVNSDPGRYAHLYDGLPEDIPSLCGVVQQTLLHMFWIGEETYGLTHRDLKGAGRKLCVEFSLSTMAERLASIVALDTHPLSEPRDVHHRSVGCCRDYALMLCSILRHRRIPARVRTGVALYFVAPEGRLIEDHYITEYWNDATQQWRLVDPQIDEIQRPAIEPDLDTGNLPRDVFLTGHELVEALQVERVPQSVGFPPVNAGFTYGRNKLFADFVGLTSHELPVHAWWGLGEPGSVEPGDDGLIAQLVKIMRGIDANDPAALTAALELASTHPRLAKPVEYVVPLYQSPLC